MSDIIFFGSLGLIGVLTAVAEVYARLTRRKSAPPKPPTVTGTQVTLHPSYVGGIAQSARHH